MAQQLDGIFHWIAAALYAVSSLALITGLVFSKEKWAQTGIRTAFIGVIAHTGALGFRWISVGHGPFLQRYELYSAYVLIGVWMLLAVQHKRPGLRLLGVIILPVSLMVMGIAMTSPAEARALPETFNYLWIVLHIIFAQVSYGAALVGSGLAIIYLLKRRAEARGSVPGLFKRLPTLQEMDRLSYRFHGFAFLTIGVMTASGAVWANYAWGRYWSWDPIENWSLISWLLYGLYLHLRRIHGWQGARAAWFSLVTLAALLFILMGIGIAYETSHAPYFG